MGARFHEDAGFLMSHFGPKTTGIDGVVICLFAGEFERPGHQLGPRLLVALGNKLTTESLNDAVTVFLTDPPKVMSPLPMAQQVVDFINKNRDAVLRYWNCELDTKETLNLLESL
jgi:hypothetical protein